MFLLINNKTMKPFFTAVFAIVCLSTSLYGQRLSMKDIVKIEVNHPDVTRTQGCDLALQITRIIIDAEYTRIDFVYSPDDPYGVNIPRQPHLYLEIKADDGNTYKAIQTGGMKNYGNNVKKDRPEFFSVIFEKMPLDILAFDLVEAKPIEGVYKLPKWNFYDVRIKTEAQILAEIKELETEAAKGDANAMYELGLKYEKGKEVAPDKQKAFEYYLKGAENGSVDCKELIALSMYKYDSGVVSWEVAFEYLKDAANNNSPVCQYLYGLSFEKTDMDQAVTWIQKSADSGFPYAEFWIGKEFMAIDDPESAAYWYHKAAKQGHAEAQNALGDLNYFGQGTEQDYEEAFYWFQQAAQTNSPQGKYNLAHMYQNGYGTHQDYGKAIELYSTIINDYPNNAYTSNSYNALGIIFSSKGDYHDLQKAQDYYRKAIAIDNNVYSLYSLALMHRNGTGVLKNPSKAKEYMEKSAQGGYNAAQYEMGIFSKNGDNLQNAFDWFQKSANNNYAPAQYELGLMYYYGKGVGKNNALAAQWIEKAYSAGNKDAEEVWNGLELWKYK